MAEQLTPDLCVIGAGSGGLSVAAAAAALGVPVVLIEKGQDGRRLPQRRLRAVEGADRRGQARRGVARRAAPFGIKPQQPGVEFDQVNDHIHRRDRRDRAERFQGALHRARRAGDRGRGALHGRRTTVVGRRRQFEIKARRFVIATGSPPAVPPIPGLDTTPVSHQRDRVRDARAAEASDRDRRRPDRARAGAGVPPARLRRHGAGGGGAARQGRPGMRRGRARRARARGRRPSAAASRSSAVQRARTSASRWCWKRRTTARRPSQGSRSAGRRPAGGRTSTGLDLDAARHQAQRPPASRVDKRLRTTNQRVYAIGDVTGSAQFTHAANHHAGLVIRHALFRLPVKVDPDAIPRVTFTDPELAHVGLTEDAGAQRG